MSNIVKKTIDSEIVPLIEKQLLLVRDDLRDSPYIKEALRVLPVQGYRSAIGSFWNAVVDDLRNKIVHRSIKLFNREVELGREIKTYEDFQNYVNDDQLIEGAYKIGVVGWEAYKLLKHSKEARHIFYGHPKSSEPSLVKVLSVIDDCIKYVLNEEYPTPIIDIDEYVNVLGTDAFDRNNVAAENALSDLPDTYKTELINRLFNIYIHPDSTSVLISNIEFISPILWQFLPKETKTQVVRRVDQVIPQGNSESTEKAFRFITLNNSTSYLSHTARKYKLLPLIEQLKAHLDNWQIENALVSQLHPFAAIIIDEAIDDYVWAITHTYIGRVGASAYFARTDFYADGAATLIPAMFEKFNDRMAAAFIKTVKRSTILRTRLQTPSKLKRLRTLGSILLEKVSDSFPDKNFLKILVEEDKTRNFFKAIDS